MGKMETGFSGFSRLPLSDKEKEELRKANPHRPFTIYVVLKATINATTSDDAKSKLIGLLMHMSKSEVQDEVLKIEGDYITLYQLAQWLEE